MKQNAALFVISIIASLLLCEITFRVYDPKPWFEFDKDDLSHKAEYKNNRLGFRERELKEDILKKNVIRILFIGDSFTLGYGIEKERDRFSNIIERKLNIENEDVLLRYNIYNAGMMGSSPSIGWADSLKSLMPEYKPKFVFGIFSLVTGAGFATALKYNTGEIDKIKLKYSNAFWYKYSYFGKFLGNYLIKKEFSDGYIERMHKAYSNRDPQSRWGREQRSLLVIRDMCKENNIEFHLVIFPLLFGLESSYPFYEEEKEIIRFARQAGIPVYSLTREFIGKRSRSLWVSQSDQHPNEKGNRIAADRLYPYVKGVIERKHDNPQKE
jgi:hypothetical protein